MVIKIDMEKSPKIEDRERKSITINTTPIQASSTPSRNNGEPKSILKKRRRTISTNDEEGTNLINEKIIRLERRPVTLDEYINNDSLIIDPTMSSFAINEIDEDDELWLIDMPKTLNPHELKGQVFYFGDKTKLKIGNERYIGVSNNNTEYFTCIMGTGRENKRFKTLNVQPSGTIVIRKKLSNVGSKITVNDDDEELNAIVPFPENLKIRHPLMSVRRSEKKMKKISPVKLRIKKRKDESSD